MTKKLWFAAAFAGATLLLGSCQKVAGPTDVPAFAKINGDYLKTGGDGSNWAMTGFNYNEQRHSPLTQINDSNVQDLGIAWFADLSCSEQHQKINTYRKQPRSFRIKQH